MRFSFSNQAVKRVKGILAEHGGGLALRIKVRRVLSSMEWEMTLEPAGPETVTVDGVPVSADSQTQKHLDGLMIDWVQTPDGPGFGVYDRNLHQRDIKRGAH